MIGKLTGRLDAVTPSALILDVGGVGYEVTIGARTFSALPAAGETVSLAIDTHVREDEIRLYGFVTEHERAWFRALQTVQGVGAKVALAVLGTLSTSDLANAVALGDKGMVSRAPGVGPKVAMRIVAELKDKMPTLAPAIVAGGGYGPIALPEGIGAQDAVSALTNLGYGHAQAAGAISAAVGKVGRDARPEELIRLGLKELAHG
jgi:Holliday junction DNA helicase RuvA